MKILHGIFAGLFCATSALANNCNDNIYRKYNPTKCANYTESSKFPTISLIGGAALLGAGIILANSSSSSGGSSGSNGQSARQPTMQIYDTVGYTDPDALSHILSDSNYNKNTEHFNEIRLAYSLARGFTGNGSNIAVLDTGDYGWHGTAVANVAGSVIAPNANVTKYQIVDSYGDFLSYDKIADVITSAGDTKIFNSSWGISTTASHINAYTMKNRAQIVAITGETFLNTMINAAQQNDAIFVWSAGNDGTPQSGVLTALPRVIPELKGHFINVVAWDTDAGELAWYSNQCGVTMNYCITAPGSGIDVGDGLASGTSFAAPMVSGAIAVISEAFPYMTATEITQLLFVTARDLGMEGVDEVYGWGMLDLERATRPVGVALVPLADGMQPLQTSRVSGVVARRLKSANLDITFFDAFGRGFDAKLNDNIKFENRGRGFERLRGTEPQVTVRGENLEFGFSNENLLNLDGMLTAGKNNLTSFVGMNNEFAIGDVKMFQNVRFGFSAPDTSSDDSFVSGFTNLYTLSAKFGVTYKDWTFEIATPTTIINGEMNLHLPAGRRDTGEYQFADYAIDLAERPAMEYSASYKFITATFIDNPQYKDEFFIMAKTKLTF